jgi:hypothetical protein
MIRGELRATRIAPSATEALRTGCSWKILSSHRHAINYVDVSGNLLSIIQGHSRMGPFSIEVEEASGGFTVGEMGGGLTHVSQGHVLVGRWMLDLTSAEMWNARPNWAGLATAPWRADFLPIIHARLLATAPHDSLARIVENRDGRCVGLGRVRLRDLPQAAATVAASRVIRGLAVGDLHQAAEASTALAGTGIGLTPSGDDFLVGVMLGIHSAIPAAEANVLGSTIYSASAGRTTGISRAWLAAASRGQAIQAWHALVDSLISSDRSMVDRACQSLIGLGHTSGADALAGFTAFHLVRAPSSSGSS